MTAPIPAAEVKRARRIAHRAERKEWTLARVAYQWRAREYRHWPETLGACFDMSPRRVREYALAYEFRAGMIPERPELATLKWLQYWVIAGRVCLRETTPAELTMRIVELMAAFATLDTGRTVEAFAAELAKLTDAETGEAWAYGHNIGLAVRALRRAREFAPTLERGAELERIAGELERESQCQ